MRRCRNRAFSDIPRHRRSCARYYGVPTLRPKSFRLPETNQGPPGVLRALIVAVARIVRPQVTGNDRDKVAVLNLPEYLHGFVQIDYAFPAITNLCIVS